MRLIPLALLAACTGSTVDTDSLAWTDTDSPSCEGDRATGTDPGEASPDFALTDQLGGTVHLHDHCDAVVLLDLGTFW